MSQRTVTIRWDDGSMSTYPDVEEINFHNGFVTIYYHCGDHSVRAHFHSDIVENVVEITERDYEPRFEPSWN